MITNRCSGSAEAVFAVLPSQLLVEAADPFLLLSDTVRHVFAGTAARTMAQAIIHPIDTIKTRLQVTAPAKKLQRWQQRVRDNPVDLYVANRRVVHTRNWLIRGPKDVYRGLTGAVLGTIPTAILYFATYEWCKAQLEARKAPSAVTHLASASAGAVMSAFIRVPTDTVKHRVQAYMETNVFLGARHIVTSEGVRGLYQGLLPTLLRDVPEIAIQFALYEKLRKEVEGRRGYAKLRTWEHLVLGGFSGACAATATMPLDFAKTTIQCGSVQPVSQVLQAALQEHGPAGLFRGMTPRVCQTAIMSAMFFTLFEFWKAQLKPHHHRASTDRLLEPKIWHKRRDHVWKRQFVQN
ncbi:hypothetical protein ABBQ38_012823 [Trebouxia sp. C0009 RCD-2024]